MKLTDFPIIIATMGIACVLIIVGCPETHSSKKTCTYIITKELGEVVCRGNFACDDKGCAGKDCTSDIINQPTMISLHGNALYKENMECPQEVK